MKVTLKPASKTAALLSSERAKVWPLLCKKAKLAAKTLTPESRAALLAEIHAAPGMFPKTLAADLRAAPDLEAAKKVCEHADRIPARWLLVQRLEVVRP